ncbi:MAG: hypothetical protein UX93_C0001G0027 [Microgenomates group bacterium GW2011_GWC1_47_20]|nr:MAG: hypothetical protein UX93_C0001G0027 [Microgenomates group bacterium GW2011_GWC1_47_20]
MMLLFDKNNAVAFYLSIFYEQRAVLTRMPEARRIRTREEPILLLQLLNEIIN